MITADRPTRSVLYIPGSREASLDKATVLPADAIIFDLEDAVAPDEKPAARDLLVRRLPGLDCGSRARIVRINGLDTPWGADDAQALAGLALDAVLIPKVCTPEDVEAVARFLPHTPLWAMMETAAAMLNAGPIAAHPRMGGMVMGTNDLAKELGTRFRPDRLPLVTALSLCVLAAKSRRLTIIDGVYNAFKDETGLRLECEQARDLGFDGKTLIHPAQIAVANDCFAPTQAELDLARRQIEAFDGALAQGKGVAVIDGRIVEKMHVQTARATLSRAAAIAAMAE
jgi:(3S)-malyl-CoA thioesterase